MQSPTQTLVHWLVTILSSSTLIECSVPHDCTVSSAFSGAITAKPLRHGQLVGVGNWQGQLTL